MSLYLAGGDEKVESAKQPLVKKPIIKEEKPDIWKKDI